MLSEAFGRQIDNAIGQCLVLQGRRIIRNVAGSQWRFGPVHDDDWIVDLSRRASSLGQQVRCSALARLILEIGIGQRVAVSDRHAAGSDADYAALVRAEFLRATCQVIIEERVAIAQLISEVTASRARCIFASGRGVCCSRLSPCGWIWMG